MGRDPARDRGRWPLLVASLAILLALVVALGFGRAPAVVIGAKSFTEQQVLAEWLAQEIEARTALQVRREFSLGSTPLCHLAVRQGRIDGYVEYTGTAWSAILRQAAPASGSGPMAGTRQLIWQRARQLYQERFGLRMFPSLGFENSFAILVRRADAQRLGLRRITDVVLPARHWRAAFGYEFLNRADGYPGLERRYGLRFAAPPLAMDLGLTYRALAEGQVDLIAGDSTNGLIPALQLQALEDDLHYFPPYDAVPVFNGASLRRHPELVAVVEQMAGRLSPAAMQRLNAAVDLDHRPVAEVVRAWRSSLIPADAA